MKKKSTAVIGERAEHGLARKRVVKGRNSKQRMQDAKSTVLQTYNSQVGVMQE